MTLSDTMLAVWLEDQKLSLRKVAVPTPSVGQALIQVHLAGICATDLEMVRGYYPFDGVLGHEFVGHVASAPGHPEWDGKRVVGEINISCGECRYCHLGMPTHCENRATLGIHHQDGAFAEYMVLPLENLLVVPPSVGDEMAVFTEPLAAALEIPQQVHIRPGDRVLLVGAGRLGQLNAQILALTGCDLKVVARHDVQRHLLAERGISIVDSAQVESGTYDLVVEATGNPSGFALARRALRPRGVFVLKSTYKGDVQINLSSLVVDEITVVGSRCGPFAPALNVMQHKQVDPRPLISARYPLSQAMQAFEYAAQPGVLKVLLEICDP